ncbi:MAG: polysaccharide deacetylase family protein [Symploca sp. SIO1B1]|nr:polysaccharide deacetylase family protein [Symploca sp. SIO1B1]
MSYISISVDIDTLKYYSNFCPGEVSVFNDPILLYTLPKLLELFAELDIRATFFVIGETIKGHESLFRQIATEGHELASHSQTHIQGFHQLSLAVKRQELEKSKKTIEDCTGYPVVGFRAPAYNIDFETLKILTDTGYHYDSSLFPDWYVPLSKVVTRFLSKDYQPVTTSPFYQRHWLLPRQSFYWELMDNKLLEIPLPTTRFGKPFMGTIHLSTSERFFTSEVSWLAQHRELIPYEVHPTEVADDRVFESASWLRNIPGVGKRPDPWKYLRFRLQMLLELGNVILMREVENYSGKSIHPG